MFLAETCRFCFCGKVCVFVDTYSAQLYILVVLRKVPLTALVTFYVALSAYCMSKLIKRSYVVWSKIGIQEVRHHMII